MAELTRGSGPLIGIDKVPDRDGGVACSVHIVLGWMVFQWASMAEDPMEV